MKSVLVTGATGYLGRHLLNALHVASVPAVALARNAKAWPREWAEEVGAVKVVEGTPLSPDGWVPAVGDIGTIVHTAAVVKHSRQDLAALTEMHEVNVEGSKQVVRAAARLGARAVLISTSGTVGCFKHGSQAADEHAPYATLSRRWPYYASKVAAERECRTLAGKLGVELSIVRLPVLLGPKDHKRRSVTHVTRVLDGHVPFVPAGGVHFTDVRDVAQALVRLSQLDQARPIYHLPGTQATLAGFFRMVCEVSGATLDRAPAPGWLVEGVAKMTARLPRKGMAKGLPDAVVLEMATCHWGLSSLFSEDELGYRPRPARQTLVDTVEWLRSQDQPLARAA